MVLLTAFTSPPISQSALSKAHYAKESQKGSGFKVKGHFFLSIWHLTAAVHRNNANEWNVLSQNETKQCIWKAHWVRCCVLLLHLMPDEACFSSGLIHTNLRKPVSTTEFKIKKDNCNSLSHNSDFFLRIVLYKLSIACYKVRIVT